MYKQMCFMFWAWFYSYKRRYSVKQTNSSGKEVRQYVNWRDLWAIAMMESAKFTMDAVTKYNNPFNFTKGSWMDSYVVGTYKGESANMAYFKSMRLGVKCWFDWMTRNKFFSTNHTEGYELNGWWYFHLVQLTEWMGTNSFYTANPTTYYEAAAAYQDQSKKLSSPRTWVIAFAVVMAVLIAYVINLAVKRKKRKSVLARMRRMKTPKTASSWKAA